VDIRERADGSVTDSDSAPALEMRGVTKRFGDVIALDRADFVASRGSVHALLGENGAGKSTLMRIAYGLLRRDAGHVRIFGHELLAADVRAAVHAGAGMVHQHLSIVPALSVVENLLLGGRGRFDKRQAARMLEEVSRASGLHVPVEARARDLSIVEQQRLEILKALARQARLLILDEPTAVLAPQEIDDLLAWIRSFANGGGTIVLVTHKLREALAVSDRITVLRQGRVVLERPTAGVTESELAQAMFPEAWESAVQPAGIEFSGDVVASAVDVTIRDSRGVARIRSANFDVRAGEIVGIAGVEGSGHRELLLALARRRAVAAGHLRLPAAVSFIPADRVRDAIVPEFTLVENVALRDAGVRRGLMPWNELATTTEMLVERFAIVTPSVRARAGALSGGNQQRLVVARELEGDVALLVADNPSRGLDMRATMFVHDQLRRVARAGAAIVVHSSDLDELLALATRILVVFHGEVRPAPRDRGTVGRAMLGAA
jgi:simple sugar transport system ATP-binding protein